MELIDGINWFWFLNNGSISNGTADHPVWWEHCYTTQGQTPPGGGETSRAEETGGDRAAQASQREMVSSCV